MFTGTVIGRSSQEGGDLICLTIRPDVVAGLPGDMYALEARDVIPLAARVRCAHGPPTGVPGFLDRFVTILSFWVDPARI